jgi:hypothetical protein
MEVCTLTEIGMILNPPVDQMRDRIPKAPSEAVQFALSTLRLAVSCLCLHHVDMCFIGRAFSNGAMGTTRRVPTADRT